MYGEKTYIPQMAKTMSYLGKYVHEHRVKLFQSIDADDRLTKEQKKTAKKVLDEVVAAYGIFSILNQSLLAPKILKPRD